MFKLLAISGSPRKHGNSEQLLDEFIKGALTRGAAVEKIQLIERKITPCNECLHCAKHRECIIQDDMQYLYSALTSADGIVISSPVFFMGPPSHLKAMIDRCQMIWCIKYIFHKPVNSQKTNRKGFLLSLGALPEKFTEKNFQGNINSIRAFYHVLEIKFTGHLVYGGVDQIGEINSCKNALQETYKSGVNFICE